MEALEALLFLADIGDGSFEAGQMVVHPANDPGLLNVFKYLLGFCRLEIVRVSGRYAHGTGIRLFYWMGYGRCM